MLAVVSDGLDSFTTIDITLTMAAWGEEDVAILRAHGTYHQELVTFIASVLTNGPGHCTAKSIPKKPPGNLSDVLGGTSKQKKTINSKELHLYLKDNLSDGSSPTCVSVAECDLSTVSLDILKTHLVDGYKIVRENKRKNISASISYGEWLIEGAAIHKRQRIRGETKLNWTDWLKLHVKISKTHVHRLSGLARLLREYRKFHFLALSFRKVFSLRKEIEEMFKDKDLADFWKS